VRGRSRSIPSVDAHALRRARLRTGVLRALLAGLALGLLVLAVLAARGLEPRGDELVPGGRSGVVVLDVSLSIAEQDYAQMRAALERVIAAGQPTGLVLFSDVAYELLPPRSPVAELRPLLRFFPPGGGRLPPNPWTSGFQAGTRISAALELAHRMLRRDRISPASILLVSDLQTAPADYGPLGRTLGRLVRAGVAVRVVPLAATSDGRAFFGGILGEEAFVEPPGPAAGEPGALEVALRGETPLALLLASALALLALAAHERLAGRLALPAGAGRKAT